MKYGYIAFITLLTSSPMAFADDMSDSQYLTGQRCIAYSTLPQLSGDALNITGLQQAIESHRAASTIRSSARRITNDVELRGRRAGDNAADIAALRLSRDEACAGFVQTGLIQASTPQSPAS